MSYIEVKSSDLIDSDGFKEYLREQYLQSLAIENKVSVVFENAMTNTIKKTKKNPFLFYKTKKNGDLDILKSAEYECRPIEDDPRIQEYYESITKYHHLYEYTYNKYIDKWGYKALSLLTQMSIPKKMIKEYRDNLFTADNDALISFEANRTYCQVSYYKKECTKEEKELVLSSDDSFMVAIIEYLIFLTLGKAVIHEYLTSDEKIEDPESHFETLQKELQKQNVFKDYEEKNMTLQEYYEYVYFNFLSNSPVFDITENKELTKMKEEVGFSKKNYEMLLRYREKYPRTQKNVYLGFHVFEPSVQLQEFRNSLEK